MYDDLHDRPDIKTNEFKKSFLKAETRISQGTVLVSFFVMNVNDMWMVSYEDDTVVIATKFAVNAWDTTEVALSKYLDKIKSKWL